MKDNEILLWHRKCPSCGASMSYLGIVKYKNACKVNSCCKICRARNWARTHREKSRQIKADWRIKNPNYHRQYVAENRVKIQEKLKKWYAENRQWVKEYRARPENRDKKRIHNKNRRGRTKDSDVKFSFIKNLLDEAKFCPLCFLMMTREPFLDHSMEIDHIIPLCDGGRHMQTNLRVICRKCNNTRTRRISKYLPHS